MPRLSRPSPSRRPLRGPLSCGQAWTQGLTALLLALLASLCAVPVSTAGDERPGTADEKRPSGSGDKRPAGAAQGKDLSKSQGNPLLRPALRPIAELRFLLWEVRNSSLAVALDRRDKDVAFDANRNGAVVFLDPTRLTDVQIQRLMGEAALTIEGDRVWRSSPVALADVRRHLEPSVVRRLHAKGVTHLFGLGALNVARSLHSEQLIQERLDDLGIGDEAVVLGASERQQCEMCAPLYSKATPLVYGRRYGLTVEEFRRLDRAVAQARKAAAHLAPEARAMRIEEVKKPFKEERRTRSDEAYEQLQIDLEGENGVRKVLEKERGPLLATIFARPEDCPAPAPGARSDRGAAPIGPAGRPLVLAAAVRAADPCAATQDTSGSRSSEQAGTGLGSMLAAPGMATGGIDFSSMELRHLADPGDGSGLRYSFSADFDPLRGDARTSTGRAVASQSSDAFFVWLSLNPADFWVNLHPDQPDRIVDHRLGRTDAGRVLLEADLEMKKTVGRLIHPHTALGKRFWNGIRGDCMASRMWIVPAPASVYEDGDKLYILDAPLDVKVETEHDAASARSGDTPTCPHQDQAIEEHNEQLDRALVLPKLRKAINTAPEYAALRRVYLARVAAEWYRELSTTKDTSYGELVNSGDITDWQITGDWTPRHTFDKFRASYTKGEFKVTDRSTSAGTTYVRRYAYGGVDLTRVPLRQESDGAFGAEFGTLPEQVERSLRVPAATGSEGTLWVGAPTPREAATGRGAPADSEFAGTWAVRLLPLLLVPLALSLWRRRRLRTRTTSPLRRAATGGPRRRP
ncbi:hypothetical protein [Streptomyces sp. NPDC015345]|uniref:hypothetical protein n=1 Tax=Streptomyces sp. NPDC015345 TaxID=3364953 RepID=UPI0036F7DA5F